jgi:Ca2+-binding RTX toxin-like protein
MTMTDALVDLPLVQLNGDPADLFVGGETVVFVINRPLDSSNGLTIEAKVAIGEANALEAAANAAGRPIDVVIVPLLAGDGSFGAGPLSWQAIDDQALPGIRILRLDSQDLYQLDPNNPNADPYNPDDYVLSPTGLAVQAFKQAYVDATGKFYGDFSVSTDGPAAFYLAPATADVDVVQYAHAFTHFQATLDDAALEAALAPGGAIDLPSGRFPPVNLTTALGAFDQVGEYLPNFTFIDADSASVSLLGQTDGLVVLSVCAEWCPPCAFYSKEVGDIAAQVGNTFTFLELMTENVEGGPALTIDAQEWRHRFHLDETVMTPNGDLSLYANFVTGINLAAFPTYLVYDGVTGEIVGTLIGFGGAETFVDQLTDIETAFYAHPGAIITGGATADSLNGTRFSDKMSGLDGADTITGGFGNDTVDGGAGLDRLVGGAGDDTYVISDGRIDLKTIVEGAHDGSDTLEIAGGQQNIRIAGALPANVERLVIDARSKLVDFGVDNARAANVDFTISADATTISRIGSFTGGKLNDVIHVELRPAEADVAIAAAAATAQITINGGTGNDTITVTSGGMGYVLDGGAGADNLTGSFGDDIYVIDNSGDQILEDDGDSVHWTNADVDAVVAFYGINEFGEATQNLDQLFGGDSDLSGLSLEQIGNLLNAVYGDGLGVIDPVDGSVTYPPPLSGGHDLVQASVSFDLATARDIEDLTLTGTGKIDGSGNALNNMITGNSGNNVLDGRAGDDKLLGRDGADKLLGGAGNDDLNGGTGNDTLTGGEGRDTMNGAAGDDLFVFGSIGDTGATLSTCDVIDGFGRGGAPGRDVIDLSGVPGVFSFVGTAAFGGNATNEVRYEAVDTDGDGKADSTLVMLDNDLSNDVDAAILLRGYVGKLLSTDFLL